MRAYGYWWWYSDCAIFREISACRRIRGFRNSVLSLYDRYRSDNSPRRD